MTVGTFDPSLEAVTMTEAALKHFARALEGAEGKMVRLSTRESGCTGYAYVLDPNEPVRLAVAPDALKILRGTEIDYVAEGVNSVVKFNNPNVVAECGCGESFSVS
jgi:iron-sulfur cluster assembly accessory protein